MKDNIKHFWGYYVVFLLIIIGTTLWAIFDQCNFISIISIGATILLAVIALYQSAKYKLLSDKAEVKFMKLQEDIKEISNQIYILSDLKEIPNVNVVSRKHVIGYKTHSCPIGEIENNVSIALKTKEGKMIPYDIADDPRPVYVVNDGRNIIIRVKLKKIKYKMYYKDNNYDEVTISYNKDNDIKCAINREESVIFQIVEPFNINDAYIKIDQIYYLEIETDIHNVYNLVVGNKLTRIDQLFNDFKCSNASLIEAPYKINKVEEIENKD